MPPRLVRALAAPLVASPELYVWAVVAIAATAWQQSSFRAGSLAASLLIVAVAVMVVATVALARSEASAASPAGAAQAAPAGG